MTGSTAPRSDLADAKTGEYVTFDIDGQLFGVPVSVIHDVFAPQAITPVPLSRCEIAGVLNLRGRIVTAVDARARLGLGPREDGGAGMAIGIERGEESYGLIVDRVGEVLRLGDAEREPSPNNLDGAWQEVVEGVFRLDGRLMMELDIDRLLDFVDEDASA